MRIFFSWFFLCVSVSVCVCHLVLPKTLFFSPLWILLTAFYYYPRFLCFEIIWHCKVYFSNPGKSMCFPSPFRFIFLLFYCWLFRLFILLPFLCCLQANDLTLAYILFWHWTYFPLFSHNFYREPLAIQLLYYLVCDINALLWF